MRISNFALAVLATSAAAVPHRRHAHPHPVRREADVVSTYVVETDMAVLYVDQNGNPVATSAQPEDAAPADPTLDLADNGPSWDTPSAGYGPEVDQPQPLPTQSSQDSSSEAPYSALPQTTQAPPSSESGPDTSSAAPPTSAVPDYDGGDDDDGVDLGYSVAYSPYHADHSCKTETEVDADIDKLNNYGMVRIYGTDCDQVRMIMNAARRNDMKVFAGVWNIDNAAAEASIIADAAKDDWSRVQAVSVGNELLSTTAVSQLTSAIGTARSVLRSAGYTGDVTTVDVWITLVEKLADTSNGLCEAMDFIAANCHPFFDGNVAAEGAGEWVAEQQAKLSEDCHKDVVITESGWPNEGPTNGRAVPGLQNQRTVINGLRSAFADKREKMVLFSAYNDPWKQDNGFGVEHFWGFLGDAPSAR